MSKKRSVSKVVSMLLAGTLLLTGCQTSKDAAGGGAVMDESDGRMMEGNLYLEGLPIVKEQETFTIAVVGHPLAKDTYESKPIVKKLQEETNIKIKWMEIPSTGWEEKINVMFASGELPDAIFGGVSHNAIVKNLPQLVPIGDYLEQYAPYVYEDYQKNPEIITSLEQEDGKIYTYMTNAYSSRNDTTSGLLFINQTWLDNLGLEMPATVEEYYYVLKAFKEGDPNGNGLPDEIPLSFSQQFWATQFRMLLGFFGVADDDSHVMIEDGELKFAPSMPEYYEALKYFNRLASEGLLDVEGFSQTSQQLYSKGQQMVLGSFLEFLPYFAVGEANESQYKLLKPLKAPGTEPVWDGVKDKFAGWNNGFLITKACKNPKALVRWFDYNNSTLANKLMWQWGERNVLWDMDDDTGSWWNQNNLPEGQTKGEYRYSKSAGPHAPVFLSKDELSKYELKDDPYGEQRNGFIDEIEPYYREEILLSLFDSLETTEEKSSLQVEINNYVKNFTAQAVLSGIDDVGWQEHLVKLERLNVKRFMELQQELYDRMK